MTDGSDTCGAPTQGGDGPPCQHPTTDDGDADRCWIDAHNDAEPDAEQPGRPFAIDEDDRETLLESARKGFSKSGCARSVGVSETALSNYLESHAEFKRAFTRARHEGERTLVRGPLISDEHNKGPDGVEIDGQHARFLLSTSFDYVKTEKHEHEDVTDGDGGFGTNIIVSGEYDPEDGDA